MTSHRIEVRCLCHSEDALSLREERVYNEMTFPFTWPVASFTCFPFSNVVLPSPFSQARQKSPPLSIALKFKWLVVLAIAHARRRPLSAVLRPLRGQLHMDLDCSHMIESVRFSQVPILDGEPMLPTATKDNNLSKECLFSGSVPVVLLTQAYTCNRACIIITRVPCSTFPQAEKDYTISRVGLRDHC